MIDLRLLALIGLLALVAGCSSMPFFGDDDREQALPDDTTEQQVYRSAQRSLRASNFQAAITKLQRLEARFPFGDYAEQAQLELIYAYFMAFQPEAARSAADRFIRLHPQHPEVDYAYYMKGLTAYEKDRSMFDRILNIDTAARDIGAARDSFADFSQLLTRFPESEYAPDARQRMVYLRNLLAQAEINVGQYYMTRDAFVAAANRGRYVVENFPRTPSVPEGLALMIESYLKLNLPDPANDALRVLVANYPDYRSLRGDEFVISRELRNRDRSWLNIATFGLLDRPDIAESVSVTVPESSQSTAPGEPTRRAPRAEQDGSDSDWVPFR